MKIHIESGKIFYDNEDTNESIFNFISAQNNPISGEINHMFTFDRDYKTYFQWISNAFNETERNKLDLLANLNSKFLFYNFNDFLQQKGREIEKVKHTVVTNDYLAGEKIQDKNWKYFVQSALNFPEKSDFSSNEQSFLLDTKENIEILKKTYEQLFNQIEKNQIEMFEKMPFDFYKDIENDLRREQYLEKDFMKLDTWVSFYFKLGRFPGESELTILPQSSKPKTIDPLSIEVSPLELYKNFGKTSSKNIASFQAIVALFLYYRGSALTAKKAMEEWKNNLTFQTLTAENDKQQMQFDVISEIVLYLLEEFTNIENDFIEYEKIQAEKTNKTTNPKIITTSSPIKFYKKPKITINGNSINDSDSSFIKTAVTLEKTNIDATAEKEEENRELVRSIIDPTPGAIVTQTASYNIFENREEDESKFKLGNDAQKRLENILNNISENIKLPIIDKENLFKTKTEADIEIEKEKEEIEIEKTPSFVEIKTKLKKRTNRNSPYNLRKRKYDFLKSEESLTKPIHFSIDDNETKKIDAVGNIIDSIINRAGKSKKIRQKFIFDENNNITIE